MCCSLIKIIENQQAIGLLYDGIGVFILGIMSWHTAIPDLIKASSARTNEIPNIKLLQHLVKSRIDIMFGSIVLFLGFFIQFLSLIGVKFPIILNIIILVILFVILFYYLFCGRKQWASFYLKKISVLKMSPGIKMY
ncbi:MAG: hypothetical protein GY777_29690 [Candidatus Brocadiaceae bacterium]|nr:hypothetical protein [Candidatus Brocadiaceae bacterium]